MVIDAYVVSERTLKMIVAHVKDACAVVPWRRGIRIWKQQGSLVPKGLSGADRSQVRQIRGKVCDIRVHMKAKKVTYLQRVRTDHDFDSRNIRACQTMRRWRAKGSANLAKIHHVF